MMTDPPLLPRGPPPPQQRRPPAPCATARSADANDWTPDHAMMSGTKDQLKAMPQFKYSDYN